MSDQRKSITLRGGAADDYASQLGGGSRKRGSRRRSKQSGGAGLDAAMAPILRPYSAVLEEATGVTPPLLKGGWDSPPGSISSTATTRNMRAMVNAATANPILPTVKGGAAAPAQKAKVILAPSKKSTVAKKVLLAPPKDKRGTRKIRVALHGMRKRMTRAKKIHHESKEKPVAELHRVLVEAKLLKESSKVPEPLLRSMYKDYVLLKERAL